MASTSIQIVPSSFTTAFSKPQPEYDVFLSFRGEDTRYKFTDHLYHALVDKEIITFRDDKELKMGEPISLELLEAIEKSRIAVIIFSENYASSTWCLEELAKIVECRDRGILTVLPIFYHVEPTDVRYQKNTYAKAFAKHEKRFEENPKKLQKWRAALTTVANLSGKPLKDGVHEAKFIRSIVLWIYSKLKDKLPNDIEDDLVGISSRVEDMISYVEDMISYLDMESTDVHFIGICEMSGMGKTTLAQAVFDKIFNQFEACSFLENVTEESKTHGIKTLQERLLCDIGKGGLRVKDVSEGMHVISNILHNRKVLIVVDDVSKKSQLESLVGKRDWFGQGSRIIVTTEDEDLLASYEIKIIYKATKLNEDEALQLFSLNAFYKPRIENDFLHKPRCENDFLEYINNFVKYAHGIPLVLKVLGSYLCTRTEKEWESAQSQLRAISPEETTKKLRIAFDGLGADEKKLFLDIACFFKGEEKNRVANILESAYFSETNLKNLIDKSLITLVGGKKLWVHTLLQQMGWEIVIMESKVAGGRSRLWLCDDVLDVLKNNTGTRHIEGMILRLPPEEEEDLNAKSFSKMKKLRLLKMCKVCLPCLSYLSNELCLLEWHDYPLESLPKSFQPGELVELIMHRSHIQQLPSDFRNLGKLKLIDLSYSQKLTHTPDFTGFSNIERLNFQGCTRLHELHPSFGDLERLILLNLKDCKRLKNLPHELNLESLKILILSGCSRVKKFPGIGRKMTSLLELYLDGTAIEELPPTIRRLTGLTLLNLQDCKNLKSFPSGIHSLTSLEIFTLSGCKCQPPKAGHLLGLSPIGSSIGATLTFPRLILFLFLSLLAWRYTNLRILVFATTVFYCFHNAPHPEPEPINLLLSNSFSKLSTLVSLDLSDCNLLALPDDLSRLSSIKRLNLSKNNFACLPDRISQLSKLKILFLDHCSKLKSLPCVPLSTQFVSAQGCTSLENYSNQVVVWTSGVAGFTIINCLGLAEDEDGKIAEVSLLDIHPFWQRYVKDQIHQIEGFFHVLPQPEIPEWFKYQKLGSFAPIPLPSNLFSDINWKGIALCVIFVVPSNSSEISPGLDTKYFHEFYCRLDINEDLIVFKVPKETYVGSFGLWLYISQLRFGKHLNERSCITPLIGTNSPDIEIKMCGARILYEQDIEEFLQNLSQKIFGSPNDLCGELKSLLSSLYQVDWARNHLYDYIFPQIACPPRWFAYQNSSTIKMQLPSNLHDNSRWLGFTIYALYTTQMQRNGFKYKQDSTIFLRYSSLSASDEVSFAPYTAFPLSGDVFDESSLRLVVFYIPRLLFQLNRCSHIVALFESNDPCVQVEKCGIRLVYRQDVAEFVQALVEYMSGSPDTNRHSFSKNLSHQLRMLQDCNHEEDYCCSFLPERRPTPLPKLLPSNETIQGECTSRETIFSNQVIAAGTSKNSNRRSIYLGKISSSLECLQDHYDGPGTFNQCLPQSEIPGWFKSENIADKSSSVTIPLPLNLYDNPDWMGFAFCAVFSFQEHPTSVGSGFSFIIVCHLKTNLGCMNPLLWYSINEEDVIISLHERAFLWVSFIPRVFLSPKWSGCTLVEFSFVSNSSDVLALKCGVDLVYRKKLEFTRTMVQCITSYDGPFTSYGRFPFYHPNQFSGSDGSSGTSGHYSYECPFQFYKTAAWDRYNNGSIFGNLQSEIPKWSSHDSLPSDLSPKFDFNPSTSYTFCFPPSKIQDWFSHQNHGCSATMDLPSNLYRNSNWMGLILYASFSIQGDSNFILGNLNSGKSHSLYCKCQMSMANVDDQTIAFSTSKEEIMWLLELGEFIWISYVPGEPFKNIWQHCSRIEASFVSDWPGVMVQNCALQLLYQHDQVQFEQELKHCNNLISENRELIRKQQQDQKKRNEQYQVDGLQRKIFSNIDFEVKSFPRLIDQPKTDETETEHGQSNLLENLEKVGKWRVASKEVTKISEEHLKKGAPAEWWRFVALKMSSKPGKKPDSYEMSHISSEKAPWRPKKMVDVANNAAGSDNDSLYEPIKLGKVAKAYVDSSQDPTSKPGQKDPKSRRKPHLAIDPPSDLRNMDQPVGKFVSNSNSTYNGIPSPSHNGIPSPRTPGKSEFPITATVGTAGVTPASTKINGGKSTSSFINPSQGIVNSSRSNSLEGSNTPLRPHTGGDVRWDAINIVSKGSPLNHSHFRLLKRIGYGDIGSVYLVELSGTKTYFAMKVTDEGYLARRKKLLRAQTEREILGLLDHPFLPTLYSSFENNKLYFLVTEFCSGGDLHILRQKQPNKHFTEEAARFYASEVLLALEYLHMLGIVYRDLKPENVLVREEGHIMLSDFDLSLRCSVSPTLVKSSATNVNNIGVAEGILDNELVIHGCMQPSNFLPRILPSKKNRKSKSDFGLYAGGSLPELMAEPTNVRSMSFVGTHEYLAPEIIREEGHGSAVDWWTFGIFLYELLYGKTPFKGSDNRATLFNVVGQPLRFPETPQVSIVARNLIRGLLVKEPHKRIAYKRGATEIKQHPFFEGVNWALVRCATPPHIPDPVDFSQYASKEAVPAEKKMIEIGGGDKNSNSPKDPPYIDFEYF